jgi:hypothetical protein
MSEAAKKPDIMPAPEAVEGVRNSVAKLERLAQAADLSGDPTAPVLAGMAETARAQHRLLIDSMLTTKALLEEAKRVFKPNVTGVAEALAAEAKGRIAAGCIGEFNQNLAALMRKHTWRNTLIGAGLLTAALAIGAGGGYWFGYHGAAEERAGLSRALTGAQAAEWRDIIQMNDIASAPRQCGAQQGGEACAYTLWTKLPKAGQ